MNIYRTFRTAGFFNLMAILAFCSALHAQPAGGKWSAASQLPLLTGGRMVFADSLIGYYIGSDTGYVTKNGGLTWTQMSFPSDARPAPTFLSTPDRNTVIAFQRYSADSNGVVFPGIIKSTNMGSTWSLVDTNVIPGNVHAFTMWTATDGFRIWEDDHTQQEACAVTHDGGKTFTDIVSDATLQKYITQIPKNSVSIKSDWSDSQHGVIAVSGNVTTAAYPVLLTSDGGRTWNEQYLKHKGDSTVKFSYAYMYPGSGSIWVVPSNPKQAQFYYYSADFGKTWVVSDTIKSGYISKLSPVSPTATWVFIVSSLNSVFSSSNVIAYNEPGVKWIYVDTLRVGNFFFGPAFAIQDIQSVDPTHGWVRAIKQIIVNSEPVVTDTAYFYRFATSIPNSVPVSAEISRLRFIPNPASSMIKIDGFSGDERMTNVKLTNTLGKQCSCTVENIGSETRLDVRSLPNGCYFVTITTSQRRENIPVMIMH